jgi:hypothetical protein
MQAEHSASTGSAATTIARETEAPMKAARRIVFAVCYIVFALGKLPGISILIGLALYWRGARTREDS